MHRKILKVLNDQEITFCTAFIKEEVYGLNEGDSITINLLTCLVPTICHEILHELYPELSEREILTMEKVVYSHLTMKQKISIYRKFMGRCINGEKEKRHKKEARLYNEKP